MSMRGYSIWILCEAFASHNIQSCTSHSPTPLPPPGRGFLVRGPLMRPFYFLFATRSRRSILFEPDVQRLKATGVRNV